MNNTRASVRSYGQVGLAHWLLPIILAGCTATPTAPVTTGPASSDCTGLVGLPLPSAVVLSAEAVAAGHFKAEDIKGKPELSAFCRVVGSARPSSDSDIRFEVWLPATGWNGRLWGVGNGNFAGSVSQRALGNRMAMGYAAVATDTGHEADSMDTAWASGHLEKVVDFGHRGVHEAVVNAKRIVGAFYGRKASHAYFGACSNGGREALMEAQRYPDDYDGIIAGAPAGDWTHLFLGHAVMQFIWLADNSRRVPASKLLALQSAVLAACDGLDGVKDGVIEDPRRCSFDPSTLACPATETDRCLTPPQLETLRKLYAGQVLPSGRRLLPGFPRGSEGGWDEMQFGPASGTSDAFKYAIGFFRDFVFEDPKWDFHSFDPERDAQRTDQRLASALNATNPDLRVFAARGGKLIIYHGWNDAVIPARSSIDYFEQIRGAMGEAGTNAAVRLFMAPGVEHCAGGPGPNNFGQFSAGGGDPDTSLGAALQRWVEQGIAPERVVATKLSNDDDAGSEVVRTRPLCAWPLVARYRGQGNTDVASSFNCGPPL